jgi:hypothetical protein
LARSVVLAAIMPQPMSTPTAAGMMALSVGITEPTVAPMPKCTSGMAAMCLKTIGRRAALLSWRRRRVFHRHAAGPHLDGHAAGYVFVNGLAVHDADLHLFSVMLPRDRFERPACVRPTSAVPKREHPVG